jgi:hypothetical protein
MKLIEAQASLVNASVRLIRSHCCLKSPRKHNKRRFFVHCLNHNKKDKELLALSESDQEKGGVLGTV